MTALILAQMRLVVKAVDRSPVPYLLLLTSFVSLTIGVIMFNQLHVSHPAMFLSMSDEYEADAL